jgi:multidrug efflux pump subunit AcrA (membrane-fusion protein)
MAEGRHGAYVRRVQEDAQRCSQGMLAENERLRTRVALLEASRDELERRLREADAAVRIADALRALAGSLEAEKLRLQQRLLDATTELDRFREDRAALERQLASAEAESRRAAQEYSEVEQRSANLANLYVAGYQLHDTLERAAVLAAIREIIVNLIGSEEFAVFELSRDGGMLSLAEWNGIDPEVFREVQVGSGQIGQVARAGEALVTQRESLTGDPPLTACVPLKVAGRVTGAIAIFRLLAHKPRLEAADHELLDLLASQAGTALYCTGLHEGAQNRQGGAT